jgi:hypothetical protein
MRLASILPGLFVASLVLAVSDARVAPEFPRSDATGWVNSTPLTISGLRGRVVVLDVWTFG